MNKLLYEYFIVFPKAVSQVCEDEEEYVIKTPNNVHDKLFRDLLGDKGELVNLLQSYLNVNVTKDELEKYNSSFVTKEYENKEKVFI